MKCFLLVCAVLVASVVLLSACDETDLGSVRITLADDLSGTVTVIRVARTESDAVVPGGIEGIGWEPAAASVVTIGGSFESVSALALGEITFTGTVDELGGRLEVVVPRGESVRWPELVTVTGDDRSQVAARLSGTPLAGTEPSSIARTVKIQITLPVPHVSSTTVAYAKGVKASGDDETVALVIPLDRAYEDAPPVRWQITW